MVKVSNPATKPGYGGLPSSLVHLLSDQVNTTLFLTAKSGTQRLKIGIFGMYLLKIQEISLASQETRIRVMHYLLC